MYNKKISIVFGAYKEPKLITRTLDALVASEYKDIIIYIIDDNNPKDINIIIKTKEIIDSYMDSRIHYLKNDFNIGVPFVFNKWIDLIKTPYFLICGAGDSLLPNSLMIMYDFLEKNPDSSFVFGKEKFKEINGTYSEVKREPYKTGVYDPDRFLKFHLVGSKNVLGWSQSSALYRTEFFKVKNIPVKPFHYWDQYFHLTYLLFSKKIGYIDEYLAIRHVEPELFNWSKNNVFTNYLETIYQANQFINEYEFLLTAKKHPVTKYRILIVWNVIRKLPRLKNLNEILVSTSIITGIIGKLIFSFLAYLFLLPLKLFGQMLLWLKDRFSRIKGI